MSTRNKGQKRGAAADEGKDASAAAQEKPGKGQKRAVADAAPKGGAAKQDQKKGQKREAAPEAGAAGGARKARTSEHLSVLQMVTHDVTQLAMGNWAGDDNAPFSLELVDKVYAELLLSGDLSQLVMLETTKYLESYLWPNYEAGAKSRNFVLSVMFLINEKFRERASVWEFVGKSRENVSQLFSTLCNAEWLAKQQERRVACTCIRALLFDLPSPTWHVFSYSATSQALSSEVVRAELLKLVHVPLWDAVSEQRRDMELKEAPKSIQKQWRVYCTQKQKGKSFARETNFLPFIVDMLVTALRGDEAHRKDEALFIQRGLELVIDLLAQLPTRRYAKMFVDDRLLLAQLRLLQSTLPPLTVKLVQMLKFYVEFEVDEFTGTPLSSAEVARTHAARISRLQLAAFTKYGADNEHVRQLAVSNVGAIASRQRLEAHLNALDDELLTALALEVGITGTHDRALLQEALLLQCQSRASQLDAINKMPLYPTEGLLWDHSVIPQEGYLGLEPLALPKLNLQFLTFYDYLLRNYTLYRLEAVDDLGHHVEDVVSRMRPSKLPDGKIKFEGWARMALPIRSAKIQHVAEPKLGDNKPAEVRAEITYSVHHFTGDLRREWEEVGRHDVLFLLTLGEPTAAQPYGLERIRGCEVVDVFDEQNVRIRAPDQRRAGAARKLVVKLDPAQYHLDEMDGHKALYEGFNLLLRRRPRENVFKGILETVRALINTHDVAVPAWLADVFLGYGDAKSATPDPLAWLDYGDSFLDAQHVVESFPDRKVRFDGIAESATPPPPPYRLRFLEGGTQVLAQSSAKPDMGPFPEPQPRANRVRFTSRQVEALGCGAREGLTLIVGPPGTGKTDTAVQILSLIHRNNPQQRTIMLTHSNAALNQIFEKLIGLDIDPTHMVRLGHGEKKLEATQSFSQAGRVDALLARRLTLLADVERLAQSLGLPQDVAYTCETAHHFFFQHIVARWEKFVRDAEAHPVGAARDQFAQRSFPFSAFFAMAPRQPACADMEGAHACYRHLQRMAAQIDECQPLEVLRNPFDRNKYLLTKHSRIVAMTVVHAALARQTLIDMGFRFDNLVMEEAGQVKEIETFIPLVLQEDRARLKRVVLIGDDNQLPPVVKNESFQRYSNLDQSLFARFIRLGVPHVLLDRQGRCRPDMAKLFNWRYPSLGDLPRVHANPAYQLANAGLRWDYQFVDVQDYQGVGESTPKAHFFQNLGEAEYVVATYMWMRRMGYPAQSITILTTYRGQKHLIRDVIDRRCANLPAYGRPGVISTVDKYQGQQNDFVLLSCVRTKAVGYLRDVRRLVVAMSRARLGLYIFGRMSLFQNVYELSPVFNLLLKRPTKLQVVAGETYGTVTRALEQEVEARSVDDCGQMAMLVVSQK